MGRSYELSKKITPEQAEQVLSEIRALEDVEQAAFDESGKFLEISTKSQDYWEVMSTAVNIFRKVDSACNLSFSRFIY